MKHKHETQDSRDVLQYYSALAQDKHLELFYVLVVLVITRA